MADTMREQKLAVARKKLRQFQKKKGTRRVAGGSSKEGTPEEGVYDDLTPLSESGTLSSRASSTDLASEEFVEITAESLAGTEAHTENGTSVFLETVEGDQHSASYSAEDHSENRAISVVSEGIQALTVTENGEQTSHASSGEDKHEPPDITIPRQSSEHHTNIMQHTNGSVPYQPGVSIYDSNTTQENHISQPPSAVSEPESNPPSIEESQTSGNITTSNMSQPLEREIHTILENTTTTSLSVPEASSDPFDGGDGGEGGSVSSETTASVTTAIHVAGGDSHKGLKSSSESLRQISLQLSGLMSESETSGGVTVDPTVSELERRNSELAALLLQESQQSQQHQQHIALLKSQVERLEGEVTSARAQVGVGGGSGGAREVEGLREQLQVHIQTIGILVAEKSELQSSLAHASHTLNQRSGEVTELEGRLAGARQRAGEAESEGRDVTAQLQAARETIASFTADLDNARTSGFKSIKQTEELKTSVSELTERLSVKTKEFDSLLNQLTETKSQLAMAELHIQQLRDVSQEELQEQLSASMEREAATQRQLREMGEAVSRAQDEKKQMSAQFQQYTSQLAAQTPALQEQINKLKQERDELSAALNASQAQVAAVAAAAAAVEEQRGEEEGGGSRLVELEQENQTLRASISELQQLTLQLKEQNAAMTNDNSQLSRLVEQLSGRVEELEVEAERQGTEQVDTSRLLEAMQSDKVAAARALTQNRQLKEQLEELQSGFIIMSNKKLELTEKLEKELHTKKALNQEIATLSEEGTHLRQDLLEKDREMVVLRENGESLGSQLLLARSQTQQEEQHNSLVQQIRLEASTYADQVDELERKLKLAKIEIDELTRHKLELVRVMSEHNLQPPESVTLDDTLPEEEMVRREVVVSQQGEDGDREGRGELVRKIAALTTSVTHLESERNTLKAQLEEARLQHSRQTQGTSLTNTTPRESEPAETTSPTSFQQLKDAHIALESRFSRSMEDVAQLSDEKQQLEHVVQQLQLETESIGDYITIYQFQRGVMKQQARERELELSRLKHDREEMKSKLITLQDLVSALGQEKGADWERLNKMTSVIHSHSNITNGIENGDMEPESEGSTDNREKTTTTIATDNLTTNGEKVDRNLGGSNLDTTDPQHTEGESSVKAEDTKSPTVQRILDLLNEMEASSQVEHCGLQKFHPCPTCSGKLITV